MLPYKLISTGDNHSLNCYYLEPVLAPWFDIKSQRDGPNEHENTVLLSNTYQPDDKLLRHLDRGGMCIVDGLWEKWVDTVDKLTTYQDQILILTAGDHRDKQLNFKTVSIPNWFWYNECLWYRARDYHTYQPKIKSTRSHSFLMPIRRSKHWRDTLVRRLDHLLEDAVWSYVERGRMLPGYPDDAQDDQRYLNPDWYDETWYSLVVETIQEYDGSWFMTEKTFKPLAYYHPFLIFGQMGILSRLRSNGFETFPEIFDESYDLENDTSCRLDLIVDQVRSFSQKSINPPIVQEKLQHNHARFFDRDLVITRIQKELVEPVVDFLERKMI